MLGTRQKDIDAVRCTKKPTPILAVASHQGNHHDFGFLALEVVDSCDSETLKESGLKDFGSLNILSISIFSETSLFQVFLVPLAQGDGV